MSGREPLSEALRTVISVLDVAVEMSLSKDADYDEVTAETVKLRQIISRARLALSFIEAQKPVKVGRAN